ncbi:hypothetical protein ACFY3U_16390 [Micromonospora sp. NPDC000089]|uniref:hypothetical protein n=1 Tax=unclassified Micromonospora TaxID=2617518 RepID=UPI003684707B
MADQIVVLEDGRVHAIGRHDDLLETDSLYRKLARTQLTPAENTFEHISRDRHAGPDRHLDRDG